MAGEVEAGRLEAGAEDPGTEATGVVVAGLVGAGQPLGVDVGLGLLTGEDAGVEGEPEGEEEPGMVPLGAPVHWPGGRV